ncbi:uncharacterized protein LOC101854420 [Aplysia californica]|uniref:Uncharacterized protein LOC101854420 n=1 Tax=Aplysia californica TaxID=6500 RepID=A0ABM0JUH5_APLCA|nr:uncharacterized protein LOC101854420 [Aplysia californica]XP_005101791.1 uncharacterized protein LOC101854420 [Aplysia californica]
MERSLMIIGIFSMTANQLGRCCKKKEVIASYTKTWLSKNQRFLNIECLLSTRLENMEYLTLQTIPPHTSEVQEVLKLRCWANNHLVTVTQKLNGTFKFTVPFAKPFKILFTSEDFAHRDLGRYRCVLSGRNLSSHSDDVTTDWYKTLQ